jgi:tRNA/rRNA methyltransferase
MNGAGRRGRRPSEDTGRKPAPIPPPRSETEALAEHYEDRLGRGGVLLSRTEKAEGMKTNLRNMWSRMPLTRADVQMLHGVLRQMVRWKERG